MIVGNKDPDHWYDMASRPGDLAAIPEGYYLERWTYSREEAGDRLVHREPIPVRSAYVIVGDEEREGIQWNGVLYPSADTISVVPPGAHVERWWYAESGSGESPMGELLIRKRSCPECERQGRLGQLWPADAWNPCPAGYTMEDEDPGEGPSR